MDIFKMSKIKYTYFYTFILSTFNLADGSFLVHIHSLSLYKTLFNTRQHICRGLRPPHPPPHPCQWNYVIDNGTVQ